MPERSTVTELATTDRRVAVAQAFRQADSPDATQEHAKALAEVLRQYPEVLGGKTYLAASAIDVALRHNPGTLAVRETLRFEVDRLKESLGYAKAGPIDQLLIDQVAICYLRMNLYEERYEHAMAQTHAVIVGNYWEKKLSSIQRRYLRAVETLARVRKLVGGPSFQVNIATHGGQQIVQNAGPAA